MKNYINILHFSYFLITENQSDVTAIENVSEVIMNPFIRGIHRLKSNGPNRVSRPLWRIDLVNRPNSYLAIHDLHTSLRAISDLVPFLTADS